MYFAISPQLKAQVSSRLEALKSAWMTTSIGTRSPRPVSFLGALILVTILVAVACYLYPPLWLSNDDVGMAMAAHGYGIAAIGMPNLIFSNVLWGYLVRLIPTLGGVDGYSIATLSVLVITGTTLMYALRRLGAGIIACVAVFVLVLLPAVLTPQFTLNAGLLAVAAVMCWRLHASAGSRVSLVGGYILAFLGYLVRDQEFALVLLVAAPLLPWRALSAGHVRKAAMVVFAAVIVAAAALDDNAYQSPEWRYFSELNSARAPFTDFRATGAMLKHPDILKRHGYSTNDINLVGSWFFADRKLADPQALSQMFHELHPVPVATNALKLAARSLDNLRIRPLLPIVAVALLLGLIFPTWRLAIGWGIFLAAVIAMGVVGRPAPFRVAMPAVGLLLMAPLALGRDSRLRRHLAAGLLLVVAATNCFHTLSYAKAEDIQSEKVQRELKDFPTEPVVIWGDTFPFTMEYPVLGASSAARAYEFYALGVFTWAPFSRAYIEQAAGRGLVTRLISAQGISIVSHGFGINFLQIYCREHFHGELEQLYRRSYGELNIKQIRCTMPP